MRETHRPGLGGHRGASLSRHQPSRNRFRRADIAVFRARPALVLHLADERLVTLVESEGVPAGGSIRAVTEIDVQKEVELKVKTRVKEQGQRLGRGRVVRVKFHCTVSDPVVVARARESEALSDLPGFLAGKVALIAQDTRRTEGFSARLRRLLEAHFEVPKPGAPKLTRRVVVPGLLITVFEVGSDFDPPSMKPSSMGVARPSYDDVRMAQSMTNWQ